MHIEEIKERLNRKYAYDYEIARSIISDNESLYPSTDELLASLAEAEERLPRLGKPLKLFFTMTNKSVIRVATWDV